MYYDAHEQVNWRLKVTACCEQQKTTISPAKKKKKKRDVNIYICKLANLWQFLFQEILLYRALLHALLTYHTFVYKQILSLDVCVCKWMFWEVFLLWMFIQPCIWVYPHSGFLPLQIWIEPGSGQIGFYSRAFLQGKPRAGSAGQGGLYFTSVLSHLVEMTSFHCLCMFFHIIMAWLGCCHPSPCRHIICITVAKVDCRGRF